MQERNNFALMEHVIHFFRVKGESMRPLLEDGDLVLATDWYGLVGRPRPGDRIVFQTTRCMEPWSSWSMSCGQRLGQLTVRGTRPVSLDSQEFGPISLSSVLGKVIWRIKK